MDVCLLSNDYLLLLTTEHKLFLHISVIDFIIFRYIYMCQSF